MAYCRGVGGGVSGKVFLETILKAAIMKHIEKPFFLSVRKASKCLFSRRLGYRGTLFCGYSIVLRVFGVDFL